ncbi:MAG: hypothetical protein ACRD3T_22090 [Terriglobia bacterium]
MGDNPFDPIGARKRIEDAGARTKAVRQKLDEESLENRRGLERFHNSLALFSGGTIALSVTFLGYLKSIPNKTVLYPNALVGSWLVLLVCLVASLYCTYFNANYVHFARRREYAEKLVDEREAEIQETDKLRIVNLTPQERLADKEVWAQQAEKYGKDKQWAKKREDIYTPLWIWTSTVSRLAFPLGIGLLAFFAIKNM